VAIKYGRTEVKRIAKLLDQEWDSAEQAADALLQEALEILEARGKWTVVGQLRYSPPLGGYIDKDDADASKVCLGLFSSEAEANRAAVSLVHSASTNEAFLSWVLSVDHGSPHQLSQKRKEMHEQRAAAARAKEKEEIMRMVNER